MEKEEITPRDRARILSRVRVCGDGTNCYCSEPTNAEKSNFEYNGYDADEETVKKWKKLFALVYNTYSKWDDSRTLFSAHIASLVVFCGCELKDLVKDKELCHYKGQTLSSVCEEGYPAGYILGLKDLKSLYGKQTVIEGEGARIYVTI